MILCNPDCLSDIIPLNWAAACEESTKPGGIGRLLFLKCDPSMPDFPHAGGWSNKENVTWAICNQYMFMSGEILGQKPKGSFTKKRIGSCSPEVTVSGQKTLTFQDYNIFGEEAEITWWNSIAANKRHLYFGWVTCDDYLYMPTSSWDIEIDEVSEDTSDGSRYVDGAITFQGKEMVVPVLCTGLNEALSSLDYTTTCYS